MASEQSTERIIDLIYGELPEEEEEQMRKELADSAELRAEFDSYQDLLGEVRTALPPEEPSASVHESIMDAARKAAENGGARRAARRSPESSRQMGIWGRLSNSNITQIATVAAVLLAGVFVVRFLNPGADRTMAPASDISAAREPAPAMAEKVMKEEAASETQVAEAPAAEPAPLLDEAEATGEMAPPAEAEAENAAARARADEPREPSPRAAVEDTLERKVEEKGRTRPQKRKRAPRRKKSAAKAAPEPVDKKELDLFQADRNRAESDDDSTYGAAEGQEAKPSLDSTSAKQAEAEPMPAREYRPEPGTLSAVEQEWRSRDYSGTVSAADEFLQAGQGTQTDKARAMHLKAQAYMKQGRYSQAERLFATIQKNYPQYMTSTINAGRAEAKSKLQKKPRRKSKSRPSKSDEEVEMFDDVAPLSD